MRIKQWIVDSELVLSGKEVPDIQLMPPTPQQTTLTESGSEAKAVSRQPTHPGEEILEEQEEQESTGDERKNLDGSFEEGIQTIRINFVFLMAVRNWRKYTNNFMTYIVSC